MNLSEPWKVFVVLWKLKVTSRAEPTHIRPFYQVIFLKKKLRLWLRCLPYPWADPGYLIKIINVRVVYFCNSCNICFFFVCVCNLSIEIYQFLLSIALIKINLTGGRVQFLTWCYSFNKVQGIGLFKILLPIILFMFKYVYGPCKYMPPFGFSPGKFLFFILVNIPLFSFLF